MSVSVASDNIMWQNVRIDAACATGGTLNFPAGKKTSPIGRENRTTGNPGMESLTSRHSPHVSAAAAYRLHPVLISVVVAAGGYFKWRVRSARRGAVRRGGARRMNE